MNENTCFFCKETAEVKPHSKMDSVTEVDCSICKRYLITHSLAMEIKDYKIGNDLLNCIAENISLNQPYRADILWRSDLGTPIRHLQHLTIKIFETIASRPIIHSQKPLLLLNTIADKLSKSHPFSRTVINATDLYRLKIADVSELVQWVNVLAERNLLSLVSGDRANGIYSPTMDNKLKEYAFEITPNGWEYAFERSKLLNSKNVFIAMQFNWGEKNDIKDKFIEAVKAGCFDCGYDADVVTEHHTEPIMDKIISSIKSSRFMIADFTFNNRGAYFEAGYARALGIPVIHTVMEDHIAGDETEGKRLHFDIQQINYIKWSDPKELRERICNRIKAAIE